MLRFYVAAPDNFLKESWKGKGLDKLAPEVAIFIINGNSSSFCLVEIGYG